LRNPVGSGGGGGGSVFDPLKLRLGVPHIKVVGFFDAYTVTRNLQSLTLTV
jgi:hypothetical protein